MENILKATQTDFAGQSADGLRVKIIGVGGAGTNTVDRLQLDQQTKAKLAAINTDAQALSDSPISEKVMIGSGVTRGLSAGGSAELGRKAAEADMPAILNMVSGINLVFILAGLGGGTGSGAAPVIARKAHEQGALVVAFATMPFSLEGPGRMEVAESALAELRAIADAVIPLPNDLLLQQSEDDATVLDAFGLADDWIGRGVRSICAMLFETGLINVDFATLKKAFCANGGKTLFGLGSAEGDNFVKDALESLAMCPLLHTPGYARKADRLLVNIIGGTDLGIAHVNQIMEAVTERFGSKADTVLGAVIDDSKQKAVEICVIGTTDVGGGRYMKKVSRSYNVPTQPAASLPGPKEQSEALPLEVLTASTYKPVGNPRVHTSKLRTKEENALVDQEEFLFVSEEEQRGCFDKTERNLFEGEDLDVPTYLRRGIRIAL